MGIMGVMGADGSYAGRLDPATSRGNRQKKKKKTSEKEKNQKEKHQKKIKGGGGRRLHLFRKILPFLIYNPWAGTCWSFLPLRSKI